MNQRRISEGITIRAVIIKNNPQSPCSQSTKAPDEEDIVVLPKFPIEASKAYWVAVYARSTKSDMNVTNATVANAPAMSSISTEHANKSSFFPDHARTVNIKLVAAITVPATKSAFKLPNLIAKNPPNRVKLTLVRNPNHFEYRAISDFENPISL